MLKHPLRFTPLLLLGLLLGGCAQMPTGKEAAVATSKDGTVHEYHLDNGLKLLVKENHRAPVVVSQIWYKVGSSYEHTGMTGISHVLEHMMFKGTAKHPAGEFSRIIAENGGSENAFTGRDYTAYFQQLEKSRLPIAFELEADRMRNLALPPKEFKKERQVVMEERRMRTEDKPSALTYEQFMAAAFEVNPYHNPVIGWMDDIRNITVHDLRNWYHTWYSPNNATLVVAGDVDPDKVYALAQKYFGPIKPSTLPTIKPRKEPQQHGERRITVRRPAELPVLLMGYKTPSLRTIDKPWKAYALEVLANILDGGDSSRISSELIRGREIAASAGADYDLLARHGTLLSLQGTPSQNHSMHELETALRSEVKRLRTKLVSKDELKRVKAQVTASKVYGLDSVFYQAMQLGMLETIGLSWHEADQYVDRINAVTAEQVRQVAQEYLQPDRLTVATLDPLPMSNKTEEVSHANH